MLTEQTNIDIEYAITLVGRFSPEHFECFAKKFEKVKEEKGFINPVIAASKKKKEDFNLLVLSKVEELKTKLRAKSQYPSARKLA